MQSFTDQPVDMLRGADSLWQRRKLNIIIQLTTGAGTCVFANVVLRACALYLSLSVLLPVCLPVCLPLLRCSMAEPSRLVTCKKNSLICLCALMVKSVQKLYFWTDVGVVSWHCLSPRRKFYFHVAKAPALLCPQPNRGDRSTRMHLKVQENMSRAFRSSSIPDCTPGYPTAVVFSCIRLSDGSVCRC